MRSLSYALEMCGLSDAGMVRGHNEDAITFDPEVGIAILADGMGGYNAGEVASGMASSILLDALKTSIALVPPHTPEQMSGKTAAHRMLRLEIEKANLAIFQTAQSQPQCAGMGTTLVCAMFYDNRVTIAHVGDSRVYRFRQGSLQAITRDHSLLQEQLDQGLITMEEAKVSHNKNLVTRAVGIDPQLEPELNDHVAELGDIYLLCSDGLNDMLEDDEIEEALLALSGNLPLAAQQLIQLANDRGGRDNISIILVRIKHPYAADQGLLTRLKGWLGH